MSNYFIGTLASSFFISRITFVTYFVANGCLCLLSALMLMFVRNITTTNSVNSHHRSLNGTETDTGLLPRVSLTPAKSNPPACSEIVKQTLRLICSKRMARLEP